MSHGWGWTWSGSAGLLGHAAGDLVRVIHGDALQLRAQVVAPQHRGDGTRRHHQPVLRVPAGRDSHRVRHHESNKNISESVKTCSHSRCAISSPRTARERHAEGHCSPADDGKSRSRQCSGSDGPTLPAHRMRRSRCAGRVGFHSAEGIGPGTRAGWGRRGVLAGGGGRGVARAGPETRRGRRG